MTFPPPSHPIRVTSPPTTCQADTLDFATEDYYDHGHVCPVDKMQAENREWQRHTEDDNTQAEDANILMVMIVNR